VWADLGQGVGGSRLTAEFLKIESNIFLFSLQKHEKSKKSKNRLYFGGPLSQSTETRRLFLDFVLFRIS
jgi:hypothetical protein